MIFGLFGVFIALVIAFAIFGAPLLAVETLSEQLPEPYKTIVGIIGVCIIVPWIVCFYYRKKMIATGKSSRIFVFYCGIYFIMFIIYAYKMYFNGVSTENILVVITTAVIVSYMVWTVYKTEQIIKQNIQTNYEFEREDEIKRQVEAILLAEKLKQEDVSK